MVTRSALSPRCLRRLGWLPAVVVPAGVAVPCVLITCTPTTASAQGTTDPLGPTITQVESVVGTNLAALENTVSDLELCISSDFSAIPYCSIPGPGGGV
jgi:hypothetical protein